MNVTLIGMGSGQPENLTLQGLAALRQADLILGARRLLAVLPAGCTENRAAAYRPDEVAELLQTSGAENAVLVYSGDTGFYSGASAMMEKMEALGVRARVLPGLSSIQLLAAALGRPWQGWNLVSAHGRTCDPVAECMQGRPTFFLTGLADDKNVSFYEDGTIGVNAMGGNTAAAALRFNGIEVGEPDYSLNPWGYQADDSDSFIRQGIRYDVSDFYANGYTNPMVRLVGVENVAHACSNVYASLAWDYISRFARGEDGSVVELVSGSGNPAPDTPSDPEPSSTYVVQKGDSLWKIAKEQAEQKTIAKKRPKAQGPRCNHEGPAF